MTTIKNEAERRRAVLAYLFFPAIYFLATKENSSLVTFHSKQALILCLIFALGNGLFGLIPVLGWAILLPSWNILFFAGWLFLIIKAYQGEEYKVPWVVDFVLEKLDKLNKK